MQPYAPPSAELSEDLLPRTRHALWAFLSALIALLGVWVGGLFFYGSTPWSIGWLIPTRTIAMFVVGSLVAGFLMGQIRRLKWYWAVLAGPVLATGIILVAAMAYYFFFVYDASV